MHTRNEGFKDRKVSPQNKGTTLKRAFNRSVCAPLEAQSETFAVLTKVGWVFSGPMTVERRQNVCHFAFTEDVKVAENIQTWWDIESYASKIKVVSQSKKEQQAQKMLESTTKFIGEWYEVGILWSESGLGLGSPTCADYALNEWDWTTKKSIQLQQGQYRAISTWTISSNR